MKKCLCLLLAAVMAATLLGGCAGQPETGGEEGKIAISMYMWDRSLFKELTPWLEEKFPDIEFTFVQSYNTMEYYKDLLALWCIFGSPLMIGGELTLLDDASFKLLMNEDVLKLVENDYLGRQHERDESHAIWTNYNGVTGEKHIAFFNLSEERKELECDLREVVQFYGKPLPEKLGIELWGRENADIMQGKMRVTVVHALVLSQLPE